MHFIGSIWLFVIFGYIHDEELISGVRGTHDKGFWAIIIIPNAVLQLISGVLEIVVAVYAGKGRTQLLKAPATPAGGMTITATAVATAAVPVATAVAVPGASAQRA